MKIIYLFLIAVLSSTFNTKAQQNTWIQKADFGGMARYGAFAFSIGSKGYIGTGLASGFGYTKDFWEYDPLSDSWSQKADLGNDVRISAVGFSIGSKGYAGTGITINTTFLKDFSEYDPDSNSWTQKSDFGGGKRSQATGFSNYSLGYIGLGIDTNEDYTNDFWGYNPNTDTWTQIADFGGAARSLATGFSIGNRSYAGTGSALEKLQDFWEYNPSTDVWIRRADFAGVARVGAVGFSIGTKGYIGTGWKYNITQYLKDFWEYDPATDTWTQKADFGGSSRYSASGFSIDHKGYIGTGYYLGSSIKDFWEYTPDETAACNFPVSLSTTDVTASSATLQWNSVNSAISYQVMYKKEGTPEWNLVRASENEKVLPGLTADTKYVWQVKSICSISPLITSDASPLAKFSTGLLRLADESPSQNSFQIFPNPTEDQMAIYFSLLQSSHVCVKLYEVNGKEIETLMNYELPAGEHSMKINTAHFSKGVYLVRMISDTGMENQKLVVR